MIKYNHQQKKMNKVFHQIDDFEYLTCPKQEHENQPLSLVCVSKDCEHRCLMCIFCEENQHKDHHVVPLRQYLKKAYTTVYSEFESNNLLSMINELGQLKQNYLSQFQEIKISFNEFIDEAIGAVRLYFNKVQSEVFRLMNSRKNLEKVISSHIEQNQNSSQDDTSKRVSDFLSYGFFDEEGQIKIVEKVQYILTECKYLHNDHQTKFQKIKKSFQEELKTFKGDFEKPIEFFCDITKFSWSEKMKGNNMLINGLKIQRINISSTQRFALFKNSIQPYLRQGKTIEWTFKISKLNSWIGIGICLRKKMQQVNYNFNYTSIGHGSYLISSNGYSWSHSIQADNSSFKSFYFSTNDIIKVEVDPKNWVMNFYNMGKNNQSFGKKKIKKISTQALKKFTLSIDKIDSSDEYFPCVNLCTSGDTVEILEE